MYRSYFSVCKWCVVYIGINNLSETLEMVRAVLLVWFLVEIAGNYDYCI